LALVGLFVGLNVASAANHYVRAGAAGNGSGNDWANACSDFAGSCAVSSLVRGDTYYVAAGSYAGRTFNRANSGTTTITIIRGTPANHGTDTGWAAGYDGQATWTSTIQFTTNYWVFDGATSPATPLSAGASSAGNYGFQVYNSASCSNSQNYSVALVGSNVVRHTALRNNCGSTFDTNQDGFLMGAFTADCSNITLSHTYAENNITDVQRQASANCDNTLLEYHYSKGQWSGTAHGEVVAMGGDNMIIRYSYFDQCQGTGCIASNGPSLTSWKIYGNVLNNVTNSGTGCSSGGNGAIAGAGNASLSSFEVYNNTIIQPGMCYGWFYSNGGAGNVAYNNIIKGNCLWAGNGSHDYNTYLTCNSSQSAPSEVHGQVISSSFFVSLTNKDFHLTSDTSAWTSLSTPYNTDMDGVTRSSSRGSFQYLGGSGALPAAPLITSVTIK
jgi:hypothetical protein